MIFSANGDNVSADYYVPRIHKALSLEIGGVILAAEIDEKAGTVRIVQTGMPVNGEAQAVADGIVLLWRRVKRTWPLLKWVEPDDEAKGTDEAVEHVGQGSDS